MECAGVATFVQEAGQIVVHSATSGGGSRGAAEAARSEVLQCHVRPPLLTHISQVCCILSIKYFVDPEPRGRFA